MNLISTITTLEMKQAKKFLKENLTESKVVATRLFNVNAKSLSAFIRRDSGEKNERHDKMLQDYEKHVLDDFIRSLLKHEILSADDDLEFTVDKFSDENHFIAFENEDESENAPHAKNAKLENLHTNHSIDDEFNPGDFLMT
jgi:NADH dehydrogenase/NADH:ubiquinone oxidoreductase subunit G